MQKRVANYAIWAYARLTKYPAVLLAVLGAGSLLAALLMSQSGSVTQ